MNPTNKDNMTDLVDMVSGAPDSTGESNNGQVYNSQGDKVELDANDDLKTVVEKIAKIVEDHQNKSKTDTE